MILFIRDFQIFVDYPLGPMRVSDKVWIDWNKAPMMLWRTQFSFAKWCASSACGLSSEHLRRLRSDLLNPKFGSQKSALL